MYGCYLQYEACEWECQPDAMGHTSLRSVHVLLSPPWEGEIKQLVVVVEVVLLVA